MGLSIPVDHTSDEHQTYAHHGFDRGSITSRVIVYNELHSRPTIVLSRTLTYIAVLVKRDFVRIVSLVPAATEIVVELGAADEIVGVTYACKDIAGVEDKFVVVRPRVETEGLSSKEIDDMMKELKRLGLSPYVVDRSLLNELRPDVVICQTLCNVCAVTPDSIEDVVLSIRPLPKIIELGPKNLEDILNDVVKVAKGISREKEGMELRAKMEGEIQKITELLRDVRRRRTFFMEWTDPPYCSGHWVPDMVHRVGGYDLGRIGEPSRPVTEQEIERHDPEVIILGPCGFDVSRTSNELWLLYEMGWFVRSRAAQEGEVFAVNAKRYFSSPSVHVVDGMKVLAEVLHPEVAKGLAPSGSFSRLMKP